jgi:hypothetical protein
MIKIELLQKLLNAEEAELKKIDTDRLRTLLGTFRYFVRLLEREINRRYSEQPLGGVGIEKIESRGKASRQKSAKILKKKE